MNFVKVDGCDKYNIYPDGDILSFHNNKTTLLKPWKTKGGYMRIELSKNGKPKQLFVHRLLANAFIPNPENKKCVDHINGIRDDNRLENLRWVTHKENMNGFRSDRGVYAKITKGGVRKKTYGWQWSFYMSGKKKSKNMKSKEDLQKFRIELLKKYNISI